MHDGQISDDELQVVDTDVLYCLKAGEQSLNLVGKVLFGNKLENRFDGDLFMLPVAFK